MKKKGSRRTSKLNKTIEMKSKLFYCVKNEQAGDQKSHELKLRGHLTWEWFERLPARNFPDTYSCVINKLTPVVNVQAPTAIKQTSDAAKQIPTATTQKPTTTKLLPAANTQTLAAIKQMPTTIASPTCKPS
ncbi:hypothetical protein DSO57_1029196 [Entomophthora muscae]|uniref:Uncharacterized protein n=1 Tax=Entomophthora muscae TaxID=34485 RepID=A0ACC2T1D5_9FUNG|nr:hypothetical protein DSO57_1029196 [Entomophthora muscae]